MRRSRCRLSGRVCGLPLQMQRCFGQRAGPRSNARHPTAPHVVGTRLRGFSESAAMRPEPNGTVPALGTCAGGSCFNLKGPKTPGLALTLFRGGLR
eukprot:4485545-Prymnesium_polylepis.1